MTAAEVNDLLRWASQRCPQGYKATLEAQNPTSRARCLQKLAQLRQEAISAAHPPAVGDGPALAVSLSFTDLTPADEAELHALWARFSRQERQAWAAAAKGRAAA